MDVSWTEGGRSSWAYNCRSSAGQLTVRARSPSGRGVGELELGHVGGGGAYNNSIVWPPHAAMLAARQRGRNMCEIISHLRFGDGQLWGARYYVPSKDRDGTRGGAAEPMPPCAANRGEYCNHTEEYMYPVLRL